MTSSTPHKTQTHTPHMSSYATNAHKHTHNLYRTKEINKVNEAHTKKNEIIHITLQQSYVYRSLFIDRQLLCMRYAQQPHSTHMIKLQFTPHKGLLRMVKLRRPIILWFL